LAQQKGGALTDRQADELALEAQKSARRRMRRARPKAK